MYKTRAVDVFLSLKIWILANQSVEFTADGSVRLDLEITEAKVVISSPAKEGRGFFLWKQMPKASVNSVRVLYINKNKHHL